MAVPESTRWDADPHTLAKHEILEWYLYAWFPILGKHYDELVVIDGFAGPGLYSKGEYGSPIIALNAASEQLRHIRGQVHFHFIEKREDRFEDLERVVSESSCPSSLETHLYQSRFGDVFPSILDKIEREEDTPPVFAFIDPFGFSDVSMELIHRLLSLPRAEAFTNFAVESVNRFKEHPNESIRQEISDLLGRKVSELEFDEKNAIDDLRGIYTSSLEEKARYVRPFEMYDEQDRAIYDLFFSTNGREGHTKMKEAMWRVKPEGDFRFSDATNPDQRVLFDHEPAPQLLDAIMDRFGNEEKVLTQKIRSFVLEETAFLKKHFTQAMRKGEEERYFRVRKEKATGDKRTTGFPDDVIIDFENPPPKEPGLF